MLKMYSEREIKATKSKKKSRNIDESIKDTRWFYFDVFLLEVLAVAITVFLVLWILNLGGLAWDWSTNTFNYHPLFMVLGLIVMYGNSAIIYRVLRWQEKIKVKFIHAFLNISAFILAILGLVAVFKSSSNPKVYSLHSWIGLSTVILFGFQWLFGFMAFLFPRFHQKELENYLSIHVYFGGIILSMAVVAVISGITENMILNYSKSYSKLPFAGVMANLLGVSVVLFALLVGYILHNPSYKRIRTNRHFLVE